MDPKSRQAWDEDASRDFIDHGRFFVPDRELQIETFCDLVPPPRGEAHLVELCSGEGLLTRALLERFPNARVHAFDGSAAMRQRTAETCAAFANRLEVAAFDLAEAEWRRFPWPAHAILSSLAIHHLDGEGKRALYADMARALAPGGVLLIADLVRPTTQAGWAVAAKAWDGAVRERALELSGSLEPLHAFRKLDWNYYAQAEPDPVDKPSPLADQLDWLRDAGLVDVDVWWMRAGHALFGGRKP